MSEQTEQNETKSIKPQKLITIEERKQKFVQQFQQIEQEINQITQRINQLSTAREQVRGKLILIDEMAGESQDNRSSKRRVEKIEEKLEKKNETNKG